MRKQAPLHACLWLLSDGRFASLPPRPQQADQITVIDFDTQWLQLQRCPKLAQEWGAELIRA
jgi:magnesium chelatase subunit ChlD-like protein